MFKALNNKKIIIVLSAFLSFYSLLQCFTVHIGGGLDKVVLFAGLILLEIKYTDIVSEYNKSEKTLIKIITVIYAVFWTIGKFALYNSEYAEADYRLIKLSVIFIGALFLFNMCVSYIYYIFKKLSEMRSSSRLNPGMFIGIITFFSIVYLVIYYPGTSFTDGLRQIESYYRMIDWKNHDPAFSSFLMGSIIEIGKQMIDYNFGLFLYNLLSLIIFTLVYYLLIKELNNMQIPKAFSICIMLFYSLLPIIRYYSITVCKDTLYAFLILWITILLVQIADRTEEKKIPVLFWIKLCILLLLSCNFRNDGIYVALFALVIGFLCFKGFKKKVATGIIVVLLIVFHIVYGSIILPAANIGKGSIREALSVPLQQTAYLLIEHPDVYSEEEYKELNLVFEGKADEIKEVYTPGLSDPVKERFIYYPEKKQIKSYFELWFKGLMRHPLTYVKAYIFNYYGYVYPDVRGNESAFYSFAFSERYGNPLGFSLLSSMQWGRGVMESYMDKFKNTVGFSLFFNPGFYTWILIFCLAVIIRIDKRKIICIAPSLAVILIACISPVNCRIRYILSAILCMPVIVAYTIKMMKDHTDEDGEKR